MKRQCDSESGDHLFGGDNDPKDHHDDDDDEHDHLNIRHGDEHVMIIMMNIVIMISIMRNVIIIMIFRVMNTYT